MSQPRRSEPLPLGDEDLPYSKGLMARALIALMENFQDEDGSVAVPDVLQEFGAPRKLGGDRATA